MEKDNKSGQDSSNPWHSVDQVLRTFSSSGSDSSRSSHTRSMSQVSDPLTPSTNASPATAPSRSSSQKHLESRRRSITKEKLFAHSSYADDIDFIKDQKNYLREAAAQNIGSAFPEETFIAPTAIGGYKIVEELSPMNATSYIFKGLHEVTGEAVFIKISPDFAHIEHVARFLNDWYITSGLNPVTEDRIWTIGDSGAPVAPSNSPNTSQKTVIPKSPITLPKNLPGILYPIKEFNMEEEALGVVRKSMALVYPDLGLKSIYDYYTEKIKELRPEKTSLWSGSIFSGPSEFSTDSSDRSSLRLGSENSDYVELANKVKQLSKPSHLVIEIIRDIIDVLKVLSKAHKLGICHNGITSHCILVTVQKSKAEENNSNTFLIGWDFNFSVAVEDSSGSFRNRAFTTINNMLHYISPESSSNGISSVDYRSDIYSIGVVLYELIVGCLPFRSDNLANLERMISDQTPIQPKILGPKWISNDLNYVILKCLQKNPSNRYATTDKLIEDLKLVMKSYCEPIRKENGKMGFKDLVVPTTEKIPLFHSSLTNSNNYDTRKAIFHCFNNSEIAKVIVIRGESGVGKTTLLDQISGLALNKRNFIVRWRYHHKDNNVSKHASSLFAVHSVTKQILSSSEEDINEWRNIFTNEIDIDLSILFSAIPNLKILLGPHYDNLKKSKGESHSSTESSGPRTPGGVSYLFADGIQSESVTPLEDPRETSFDEQELNLELKYSFIFKKFFTLVAQRGLTVLLENLNYCPQDEYDMVHEFLQFSTQSPDSKINFLASFKDDSTCSGTIFPQFERTAQSLGLPFHVFNVEKLSFDRFSRYIGKFTNKPDNLDITRRIYDHIGGSLLSFNYLTRYSRLKIGAKNSFWESLSEKIKSGSAPSKLEPIVLKYLDTALTSEALRMLKFAAVTCVSGVFRMSDLMIVTGLTLKEINELLHLCLETRLIVPTGICYKIPFHLIANDDFVFEIEDSLVWDFTTKASFKFDHDIIRVLLLNEMNKSTELMEVNRECGLRMKKKISKEVGVNITSYLVMTSHLYRSCDVARPEDYRHYNEALITGGRYAISTSNLPLALRYFTSTMKFVHKDDHRRKLKIILTQVQCNYLLKDFEESIRLISQAEVNIGKDNLNLAHLKVCSLFNLKKYEEGMDLAIISLQRLNIEVSSDRETMKNIAEKCYSQLPLSVSEIRNLKTLKAATNKQFNLVTSFIMDMVNPTYILDLPDVRIALLSQLVQLMHRHGQNASCAVPLLHLANIFLQPGERISTVKALELTDVALGAVNYNKGASTAVTQCINESFSTLMGQFKSPVFRILKSASSIDQPEDPRGTYFINSWMMANSIYLGHMRGYISSGFSSKKSISFGNEAEVLIFKSITGLWNSGLTADDYVAQIHAVSEKLGPDLEFIALANAVIKASSEQQLQIACEIIMGKAFVLSKKTPVSISHVWFYFISAICLANCTTEETKEKRLKLAIEIESYFKVWSTTCFSNFGSELKLIQVCIMANNAEESELTLLDMFEEAIDEAQKQQKWLGVALANRLCAKWLQRISKNQKRANEYANRAFALYSALNASSQAQLVKKDFADISDSFNWAGVRKMVSPEKPKLENTNFFEGSVLSSNRPSLSLMRDSTMEGNGSFLSEIDKIPKSEEVKSIEKKTGNEPTHSEWTEAIRLCLSISQSSSLDLIVQTLLESALMFSGVDYGAVILNFQTEEPVIKAIGTNDNIFLLEDELLATRTDLLPSKIVLKCLITGEITCKDREIESQEEDSNEDLYFSNNPSYSGLCIPIKTSTVIGVIYLESHLHSGSPKLQFPLIDSTKIDLLYLLCSQAAVSFSKSVVYTQMELAKKAAEEATDEKASFLANMSHEIRTPFNSLFACSIFLLDTNLSNVQREYVETIKDSALVTLNIIDGILAFTKIEHGSFTLENEAFSINDTIEGAISFSSEQTESEDLEFAFFNKCPQIETVHGDPTRVRQIIINLVGNALKFTSKGYVKVILEAKPLAESRYEVKISVEDTGIGIPEDSRTKVFGAFAQVDGSSRRVYGGSGLGLAISNKLAEIMNGRITFTSEEGVGSVFCFTCPFEVALNDKDPKVDHRDVCIVSSTKWKRLALKEVLEYYGATVVLFDDINDVIKSQQEFEILIIDKSMVSGDMKLRSSLNWKRSSIYVLTRFGSMLSDQRLKEIEADNLIFSPIKRKSVRKLLEDKFDWKSLPEKVVRTIQKSIGSFPDSIAIPESEETKPKVETVRPLRILIAEDNPVNLRVASQHLKKLGYIADHAKDGVEVLEKCEEKLKDGKKYDVIFMDIQMPRKDGIQATIDLKKSFLERGHEKFLPQIIALTANVAGEEKNNCLQCGMIDFVTKPILPEKLKSALLKVISNIDGENSSS